MSNNKSIFIMRVLAILNIGGGGGSSSVIKPSSNDSDKSITSFIFLASILTLGC